MKKQYIYALAFMCMPCWFSCSDFLDEKPYDFVSPDLYFNSLAEAETALLGVYDHLHHEQVGDFGWQFRGEAGTDIAICRNILRYNVYQYYQMEDIPTQVITAWQEHFKAVGDANMVINRTNKMSIPEEEKNEIIAEASFLRAYYYHHLTLMWGDVPLILDEVSGDNQSEIASLERTPVKEVYQQMIKDLSFAANNLPDSRSGAEIGRVTKWAAKALLARIYLFDGQWENASKTAEEVISPSSPHSLLPNYADIFRADNAWNNEILFAVPCMTDVRGQWLHTIAEPATVWEQFEHDFTKSKIIRPDGKIANSVSEFIRGWGVFYLTPEFANSFEDGDLRKDATVWHSFESTTGETFYFKEKSDGTAYYNLKWVSLDDKECNGNKDIILMRLGEVYLILAEAENRLHNGPTKKAYDAINELRKRAFGDELHKLPEGLSVTDFQRAIIDENRWELGGEGMRAWYLRHWGFDELKKAVEFVKDTNPVAYKNLKEHHMLYKIPEEEIVKNPNLKQNPGY